MKRLCAVYRSPRKEGMYLFVDRDRPLEELPAELLAGFGKPELALSLVLTPERRLARADAATVLAALDEKGFYLQLPPKPGGDAEPVP
ncbi:YcgL domain-containing protein [Pseudohaliea sp.]|uniref:YcgL domain-containing protein n=1 Tax=Pseudohaliea sp. TaxID=2740289 RepID=UPI0032EF0B60